MNSERMFNKLGAPTIDEHSKLMPAMVGFIYYFQKNSSVYGFDMTRLEDTHSSPYKSGNDLYFLRMMQNWLDARLMFYTITDFHSMLVAGEAEMNSFSTYIEEGSYQLECNWETIEAVSAVKTFLQTLIDRLREAMNARAQDADLD